MTEHDEIQFPINQALLEEASKIKHERKMVRERIAKIDAKKSEVSPKIYKKVREDYTVKLNEVSNALLEKKTDIDRELATLYETRSKISVNLDQHKEKLEEIKFRHQIGEYDEDLFQKESEEENEKVVKFEKILSAVNGNIEKYESIFADEEGLAESTDVSIKHVKESTVKETTPLSSENTNEDSDYILSPEEENYFAPEEAIADQPTSPSVSEITKKTKAPAGAKIVIIEGPFTGKDYKLGKETTIGRANTNTIVLKDAKVSRQHSVIRQTGNEFMIMDLNSSNGVIVNHERIKEHVLGDGDQVQIGDSVMQFKFE